MNRTIRTITAATLGIAASVAAPGLVFGADLLQAPTGAAAHDAGAWTSVVSRSYGKLYADVRCATVPVVASAPAAYDLGTAPSGQWFFAVVTSAGGQRQYGPAELSGTLVAAGSGATEVIGCHGVPTVGDGTLVAAAGGASTTDASTNNPLIIATPTSATPTAPPGVVPGTVAAGLDGGRGGLAALGLGGLAVAGLGLLGRRRRARP